MKAIRLNENARVELTDLPAPQIAHDGDVLIRITSAGICTADLEIIQGTHPFAKRGMTIGHEFGGVICETGAGVNALSPGDKVTVDPVCSCGTCHSCLIGRPNICRNLQTMGVHRDGGFCEYVVVDQSRVYKFENQNIDKRLVGVAEPFSVGAQNNARADVSPRDTVLILGAGTIGLCALQDAKRRGARVITLDLYESRLKRATRMGADAVIAPKKNGMDKLISYMTDGNGPDVIINTACYPGSVEDCVNYGAYGARIVIVGLSTKPSHISQASITGKELTILGSRLSNRLFGYVVKGIDENSYTPEDIVTHFFPCEEFARAVELIRNEPDSVGRVVLTFD